MNLLDRGMSVLPAFRSLCEDIRTGRLPAEVTGLGHIHKAVFTAALAHTLSLKTVVLVADEAEACLLYTSGKTPQRTDRRRARHRYPA